MLLKFVFQSAPFTCCSVKNASVLKLSFSFIAVQAAKVSRNESSSNEEQIWGSYGDFRKRLCSGGYKSWKRYMGSPAPLQTRVRICF